jgi:hypothetical protein
VRRDLELDVHFGQVIDATEGWNFLMRIHRPGQAVLDGTYRLHRADPAK